MTEQFDLGALLERAQAMQQQLLEAQAAAAGQTVEGKAGGGVVRVRMTGGLQLEAVTIDPSVLGPAADPDDVAMLEDLVLAACNDALARAQELNQRALGGIDAGGLGLGGPAGPGLAP